MPPRRVALIARDDSAVVCLKSLVDHGCCVLGVGLCKTNSHESSGSCLSSFARRSVDLGCSFVTGDTSVGAVQAFNPDVVVIVADSSSEDAQILDICGVGDCRTYVLSSSPRSQAQGAPFAEFLPIWAELPAAYATLTIAPKGELVAKSKVAINTRDTAFTLRAKLAEAKADILVRAMADKLGNSIPDPVQSDILQAEEIPQCISLDWNERKVDRFVRACHMPPQMGACVQAPQTEHKYLIENMNQYHEFLRKVVKQNGNRPDKVAGSSGYAADTHWYSNVGGSIVRIGDSDIHMPRRVEDLKRNRNVPGQAIGARKKLRMNEPLIGPNAENYCVQALDSSWIGVEGPFVKQFERHLSLICGCSAACAVQSGTAALYGAMKALGVASSSHHVLVPSFTCSACADAVVHAGGIPIAIDCDLESYAISLEAVKRAVEGNNCVVGVVVAPCYGVPAKDFHDISRFCKEQGLWICEDACESYGALQSSPGPDSGVGPTKVPIGSLATISVVSVRSEKMIGVGEGGAIVGNDPMLVAKAKWWCSRAPCRGAGLWRVYEHDAVGQNYRMPEMLAAVGCAAAEMLPVMIERKRAIHSWYEAGFASRRELKRVSLQKCELGDEPVWWINAALLPDAMNGETVGMRLMQDFPDIEIRPGFYPLHNMGIFKSEWSQQCPNSESLYKSMVCLPSSNQLLRADVERICDALAAILRAM